MYQKIIPYIVMTLVSGCALTDEEQQRQQQQQMEVLTNKISMLEENLAAQIASLETDFVAQSQQQLEQVEQALAQFKEQTLSLQAKTLEQISALKESQQAVESLPSRPVMVADEGLVLGEIELVFIEAAQQSFDARLDTGAATSSVNALDIELFERDGKEWVRFYIVKAADQTDGEASNTQPTEVLVETPVLRFARIRQSSSDQIDRRPVVELWVRLGHIHEKVQFTLTDRSHMAFPVLIGREFIKDIAIIDVSKKYTQTSIEQAQ